jgi:hypothetical protein
MSVYKNIIKGEIDMTRFQIAVIKDGVIYTSTEFNGDGYWSGYGHEVYAALQNVTNVEEWRKLVTEFNAETFQYNEKLHYEIEDEYEDYLDLNENYFDKWFSDYIYIKNLDEDEVEFITENGKTMLEPNDVGVFNFGTRLVPGTDREYECKKSMLLSDGLIAKFEEHDFSVDCDEDGEITFSKYSPAGQDFGFSVNANTLGELLRKIGEYHYYYDPSEEAYLWLDDTGHGRNGAPYDMKDVYEDMESCKEYIWEAYEIIEEEM